MKLVNIVNVFKELADDNVDIIGFYTGLEYETNKSSIQYPSMRLNFPYTVQGDSLTHLLTYGFDIMLLVNTISEDTKDDMVLSSPYVVNTNYNNQDDTLNEIDEDIVDEIKLRERAIRIMLNYVEGLRLIEDDYDYFTIDNLSIQSIERYGNDKVTGVRLTFNVITDNEYRCEALSNVNYSVWKDENQSLLDIDYLEKTPLISCYTEFNGINQYINCGNDSSTNFERTDPFSISLWINTSSYPTPVSEFLVSRYSLPKGWQLSLFQDGSIRWSMQSNGGTLGYALNTDPASLPLGDWVNVIMTNDGSGDVNAITISINNINKTLTTIFDTLGTNSITTTNPLLISSFDTTSRYFTGDMDEVAIFSKELTTADKTQIFNQGHENFLGYSSITNLVSWWKMDTVNPLDEQGINNGTSFNMTDSDIICEEYEG